MDGTDNLTILYINSKAVIPAPYQVPRVKHGAS